MKNQSDLIDRLMELLCPLMRLQVFLSSEECFNESLFLQALLEIMH